MSKVHLRQQRQTIVIVIIFSFFLLFFPVLFYFMHFRSGSVSNDPSDWADFSTYLTSFIGLVNVLIVGGLTFVLYRYNQQRDYELDKVQKESRRIEEINERPILVFRKFKSHMFYTLCNIGHGVALNISIKSSETKITDKWDSSFIAYSLGSKDEVDMIWTSSCKLLAAEYSDIFGNKYGSFMENDEICVFKLLNEEGEIEHKDKVVMLRLPAETTSVFLMKKSSI